MLEGEKCRLWNGRSAPSHFQPKDFAHLQPALGTEIQIIPPGARIDFNAESVGTGSGTCSSTWLTVMMSYRSLFLAFLNCSTVPLKMSKPRERAFFAPIGLGSMPVTFAPSCSHTFRNKPLPQPTSKRRFPVGIGRKRNSPLSLARRTISSISPSEE